MVLVIESRWVSRVNYQNLGENLKKAAHHVHKRCKGAKYNLNMITGKNI